MVLVLKLNDLGFEILEQKVNDYHFHEVYLKMKGNMEHIKTLSEIKEINKVDDHDFACACHWSVVEVISK